MDTLNRIAIAGWVAFPPKKGAKSTGITLNFVQGWGDSRVWDHIRVVFFGLSAVASADLKVGQPVIVEGQLQISRWVKDGQPQATPQIVASALHIVSLERPRLPINGKEPAQ